MSRLPRPVKLEAIPETLTTEPPEAVLSEALEAPPAAEARTAAETSGAALGRLASYAGALVTKAAIYTQIKTSNALVAISGAVANTKTYLKQQGGKIAARASLATLALTGGSLATFLETRSAEADATVAVHHIIHGSWYLHPGSITDTPRFHSAVSDYMSQGTEFDVQCVATGDPIAPDGTLVTDGNGDIAWEYGLDTTTGNSGFVSDQGLDTSVTQGQEIAQLNAQGVPTCGSNTNNGQNVATESPPTSIFFAGTDDANGLPDLSQIGNYKDYALSEWSSGNCSDWKVQQILQNMPPSVNTLAGWSRGRLGPAYFLETATQSQKDQIHTIILFDPGNTNDFTNGGCETDSKYSYDFNSLYANWLQSDPQNRLIIYTGAVTEESPAIGPDPQTPIAEQMNNGSITIPRFTFAGLWKYYLADIWNQPFAHQAQICDYSGMSHEDVLRNFAYTVQNPQNGCPVAANGQQPVAWNP